MPRTTQDESPIFVTVSDAARRLGVSRKTIYTMAKRGEFRMLKLGQTERTVIPYADLLALEKVSEPRQLA